MDNVETKRRNGNLLSAVEDRLDGFLAHRELTIDVLDSTVASSNEDADGKSEAAQGHDVDGFTEGAQAEQADKNR